MSQVIHPELREISKPWSYPAGQLVTATTVEREVWLQARKDMICASDVPKLFGASKWGDQYSVWVDKMGLVPSDPTSTPQRRGQIFEDPIIHLWAERFAEFPIATQRLGLVRSRQFPHIGASVDRLSICKMDGIASRCLVEVKSQNDVSEWDDDEVPAEYQFQGLTQLLATGRDHVHYVALGQRFMPIHRVIRSDAPLQQEMARRITDWWATYMTGGVEPKPTHLSAEDMGRRWISDPTKVVTLTDDPEDEIAQAIHERKRAALDEAAAKSRKLAAEALIKQHMGDAEVLQWSSGEPAVTWKAGKTIDGANAEWRKENGQLADEYAIPGPDVLALDKMIADHPELISGKSLRYRRTIAVK